MCSNGTYVWLHTDQLQLARHLSDRHVPVHIFGSGAATANCTALEAEYRHLAVIVDLACADSWWLLREVSYCKRSVLTEFPQLSPSLHSV